MRCGGSVTPPTVYDSARPSRFRQMLQQLCLHRWTGAGTVPTPHQQSGQRDHEFSVTQTLLSRRPFSHRPGDTAGVLSASMKSLYLSQTFTWNSDQAHDRYDQPQSGTRASSMCSALERQRAISHTVSPTVDTTYTADFTTQYYLTTSAGSGGSVTRRADARQRQSVQIQATADSGYAFTPDRHWVRLIFRFHQSVNVTMNGPITEKQPSRPFTGDRADESCRAFHYCRLSPLRFTSDLHLGQRLKPYHRHNISADGGGSPVCVEQLERHRRLVARCCPTSNTTYTANFTRSIT